MKKQNKNVGDYCPWKFCKPLPMLSFYLLFLFYVLGGIVGGKKNSNNDESHKFSVIMH